MSTPNVTLGNGMTTQSLFGMKPAGHRLQGGIFDGSAGMPTDPSHDTPDSAQRRINAVGPVKSLLHPHHSILFWMAAAIAGVVILNATAWRKSRKKK